MSDLAVALDAVTEALDLGGEAIPDDVARQAREVVAAARRRHGYLGETVVVALGGGTGAGKSSLLNAMAGREVAEIGAIRPTTAEPLAWIPANPEPGLVRLLDELEIERRVGHEGRRNLAIVDLPDFDSVELDHHETVERLLPRLDAVLWVLDPQKYADRRLHEGFLTPLAGYRDQFRFVLNQTDRLLPAEVEAVAADLARLLHHDGMGRPPIIRTAVPRSGPETGVATLLAHLDDTLETKRVVLSKLAQDVRGATAAIGNAVGVGPETEPYDVEWSRVASSAADRLVVDLVDERVVESVLRRSRRRAFQRGAGPVGRIAGAVRRSLLGKALGAQPEEGGVAVVVHGVPRAAAVDQTAEGLRRHVAGVARNLGDGFGAELRRALPAARLDDLVGNAVEGSIDAADSIPAAPARWWSLAGVLQFALFLGLVAGGLWLWADPRPFQRGEWPWAVIVLGVSGVASYVLSRLVRWSAERRARREVDDYRSSFREQLIRRLDATVHAPIGEVVERRRAMWAALQRGATSADRVTASVR